MNDRLKKIDGLFSQDHGPLFDESEEKYNIDDYYNKSVQIAFKATKSNTSYIYSAIPKPNSNFMITSEIEELQKITSHKCKIETLDLLKGLKLKQTQANKLFEGRTIWLEIQEGLLTEKTGDGFRLPYYLSTSSKVKDDFSVAFHWTIDDRHLFTRLITMLVSDSPILFHLTLAYKDSYFEQFNNDISLKVPGLLKLTGVKFYQYTW